MKRGAARVPGPSRSLIVFCGIALFFAVSCFGGSFARADSTTDRQLAQSLFERARELMARKEFAQACPMFVESQRLDPGIGTRLNLAICYEGQGKLASAHLEFSESLAQAIRDGRTGDAIARDREAIARDHLAAIGPRVPTLTLLPPPHPALVAPPPPPHRARCDRRQRR